MMRCLYAITLFTMLLACTPATGAVEPSAEANTPTRMEMFEALPQDAPLLAVSLFRLHDKADYNPRDPEFGEAEADVGGETALDRYVADVTPLIEAEGGERVYYGPVDQTYLGGEADAFDRILIMRFPDRPTFRSILKSPEIRDTARHRKAAVSKHVLYHVPAFGLVD